MAESTQAQASRVTSAPDVLILNDVDTTVGYTYHYAGGIDANFGPGGVFKILIHGCTTALDYVLEEAISIDGPWHQLDSGSVASGAPGVIDYHADGVLYGLILRLGVKHTTTLGQYSVQMATH